MALFGKSVRMALSGKISAVGAHGAPGLDLLHTSVGRMAPRVYNAKHLKHQLFLFITVRVLT